MEHEALAATERRFWKIRGYDQERGESFVPLWLEGGFCSMSWHEISEVPTDASREASQAIVATEMPAWTANRVQQVAGALFRFVSVMRDGDVVVTPKQGQPVHVGIVDGPHYYVNEGDSRLARRHNVHWLAGASRALEDLPDDVRARLLSGQATLSELTEPAVGYFAALIPQQQQQPVPSSPRPIGKEQSTGHVASRYARLNDVLAAGEHQTYGVRSTSIVTMPIRRALARDAVLARCQGHCENPGCSGAPRDVKESGRPILEVDHIQDIARGGRDMPEQMIALCPNCHAVKTYGTTAAALRRELLDVAQAAHAGMLLLAAAETPR